MNSSLFLPSVLSYLSQDAQVILLRAFFTMGLAWWLSRGGPELDVQGFVDATDPFISSEGEASSNANPFLDIIQSGFTHPDGHVLKIMRTFAHFSSLYGARPKGYFKGTELDGAEALDGSLFLRAARLTEEFTSHMTSDWSASF
jgi:hypothetical protein